MIQTRGEGLGSTISLALSKLVRKLYTRFYLCFSPGPELESHIVHQFIALQSVPFSAPYFLMNCFSNLEDTTFSLDFSL